MRLPAIILSLAFIFSVVAAQANVQTKSDYGPPFKSVKGRSIPIEIFGHGEKTVLIHGGIHGNEFSAVQVSRALTRKLRTMGQDELPARVVIIPILNPDGVVAGTRRNANNIDLNRNFPSSDFAEGAAKPGFKGGKKPASEPETKALIWAAEHYKPTLVISIHAFLYNVNFAGDCKLEAKMLADMTNLKLVESVGYPTPGSAGSYFGDDVGVPIMGLELPRTIKSPTPYVEALLAVIDAHAKRTTENISITDNETVDQTIE